MAGTQNSRKAMVKQEPSAVLHLRGFVFFTSRQFTLAFPSQLRGVDRMSPNVKTNFVQGIIPS
jgi:hypothetical protein